MIHLVPSLTVDGRFSVQDLPHALQLPLLNGMVAPRIASSSMMPTIQEGDRLELSPPTALTVGAIVVFQNDTLLVCHRIAAIGPQGTLWTRGDATEGACEVVQRGSVVGVVTGVTREGARISLGQRRHRSSTIAQPSGLKSRIPAVVVRSITRSIRVLAKFPFFYPMAAILLRLTATIDVLAPAPLQSLPSHSTIASFRIRRSPPITERLAASIGQKQIRYVIRLGPWRLAQYDPATGSLLLRQSLRDAGLESLLRQCCGQRRTTSE